MIGKYDSNNTMFFSLFHLHRLFATCSLKIHLKAGARYIEPNRKELKKNLPNLISE